MLILNYTSVNSILFPYRFSVCIHKERLIRVNNACTTLLTFSLKNANVVAYITTFPLKLAVLHERNIVTESVHLASDTLSSFRSFNNESYASLAITYGALNTTNITRTIQNVRSIKSLEDLVIFVSLFQFRVPAAGQIDIFSYHSCDTHAQ